MLPPSRRQLHQWFAVQLLEPVSEHWAIDLFKQVVANLYVMIGPNS